VTTAVTDREGPAAPSVAGSTRGGVPRVESAAARIAALFTVVQSWAARDSRVRFLTRAGARFALRAWHFVRGTARSVRPLGWVTLTLGMTSWVLGAQLGWVELQVLAGVALCLVTLCSLFLAGGAVVHVVVELRPSRVVAGERAAGSIVVENRSVRHLLPLRVDLPVGDAVASFDVPLLASRESHEELFLIPTVRREIIQVGPARVVRADPLGLLARVVSEARPQLLYVHPCTVRVPGVGGGFLRDLEGRASPDLSSSDLAFHSLREYVPGDDRRHVHWKTTARNGQLMVQQYVDTRRADVLIVLDTNLAGYDTEDEFELAVSVAGSVGIKAIADGQGLTVVAGATLLGSAARTQLLDQLSGVQAIRDVAPTASWRQGLDAATRVGALSAPGASIALLVVGRHARMADLRWVTRRFSLDCHVVAIRVGGSHRGFQVIGNMTVFDLATLDDLGVVATAGMGR